MFYHHMTFWQLLHRWIRKEHNNILYQGWQKRRQNSAAWDKCRHRHHICRCYLNSDSLVVLILVRRAEATQPGASAKVYKMMEKGYILCPLMNARISCNTYCRSMSFFSKLSFGNTMLCWRFQNVFSANASLQSLCLAKLFCRKESATPVFCWLFNIATHKWIIRIELYNMTRLYNNSQRGKRAFRQRAPTNRKERLPVG